MHQQTVSLGRQLLPPPRNAAITGAAYNCHPNESAARQPTCLSDRPGVSCLQRLRLSKLAQENRAVRAPLPDKSSMPPTSPLRTHPRRTAFPGRRPWPFDPGTRAGRPRAGQRTVLVVSPCSSCCLPWPRCGRHRPPTSRHCRPSTSAHRRTRPKSKPWRPRSARRSTKCCRAWWPSRAGAAWSSARRDTS